MIFTRERIDGKEGDSSLGCLHRQQLTASWLQLLDRENHH
jgi:hypothetical protein